MEKHSNGYKYKGDDKWETKLHQPYEYEKEGLLNKLLSGDIIKSANPITRLVLQYYEKTIIFLLQYVDVLKNFKNYNWKNR